MSEQIIIPNEAVKILEIIGKRDRVARKELRDEISEKKLNRRLKWLKEFGIIKVIPNLENMTSKIVCLHHSELEKISPLEVEE